MTVWSTSIAERGRRVLAIVRADLRLRFRRQSTLVLFLVLSGSAYLAVPDPATGNALLIVDEGRRALYNSAAIGMATALLVTIFVGLAGFYVISNAIGRDVDSRCGLVIASTPMRSWEYLAAKLSGNLVFLTAFTLGCMLSSMAMLLVRNEAPLEPWVFVSQYALLVPPALVLVAVLAVVFESVPWLAGRLGDVVYFVLYLLCLSFPTFLTATGRGVEVARYLDFGGLAFTLEQMRPLMQTPNLSIGGSFDPSRRLVEVPGLDLPPEWVVPRLVACFLPLILLFAASRAFHRFDPARVRPEHVTRGRAWLMRINASVKTVLHRVGLAIPTRPGLSSTPTVLVASAVDAQMLFAAYPLLSAAVLTLAIVSLSTGRDAFMTGVLPAALGFAGLAVAGLPSRDHRAGTIGLIRAVPRLKAHFVWWKLGSVTLAALTILLVPLARVALTQPPAVPPVLAGIFFVVGLATSLGAITLTPKTFTIVFLTMMYAVTSDRGTSPVLDFAGFYGVVPAAASLAYAGGAAALIGVAQIVHVARLRRE